MMERISHSCPSTSKRKKGWGKVSFVLVSLLAILKLVVIAICELEDRVVSFRLGLDRCRFHVKFIVYFQIQSARNVQLLDNERTSMVSWPDEGSSAVWFSNDNSHDSFIFDSQITRVILTYLDNYYIFPSGMWNIEVEEIVCTFCCYNILEDWWRLPDRSLEWCTIASSTHTWRTFLEGCRD